MKGQSEQMGPLLSKLLSSPFIYLRRSGRGLAGATSPESREQQKLLILRLMFTSPTYLSEGGCAFDHTNLSPLPSPKGKSDLEVRLEESAADQVVARVGKANMSTGELAGARRRRKRRGPPKPSFFHAKSGKITAQQLHFLTTCLIIFIK